MTQPFEVVSIEEQVVVPLVLHLVVYVHAGGESPYHVAVLTEGLFSQYLCPERLPSGCSIPAPDLEVRSLVLLLHAVGSTAALLHETSASGVKAWTERCTGHIRPLTLSG
jgi:hypothetical protein